LDFSSDANDNMIDANLSLSSALYFIASHEGKAPVLSTAFSSDGTAVFSGGCDKAVRMWQLQGAPQEVAQQIGVHDAPVSCVGFLPTTNMVVSGGWDKKLKFWDPRQNTGQPAGAFDMPERVHALDVRDRLMAVATADRQIITYDVSGPPREHSRKESPLKYQTRSIAVFPDNTGFAVGSIEGRVGIHYIQRVPGKESFAFKCHRKDNNVFAVNDICFQTAFGTFATVGADGVVSFWDKDNKQRLKGFDPINRTISAACFNTPGNMFAYASSYEWSKGCQFAPQPNEIFVHLVKEEEIKPKSKKTGLKSR
jgi:mRNA export factor